MAKKHRNCSRSEKLQGCQDFHQARWSDTPSGEEGADMDHWSHEKETQFSLSKQSSVPSEQIKQNLTPPSKKSLIVSVQNHPTSRARQHQAEPDQKIGWPGTSPCHTPVAGGGRWSLPAPSLLLAPYFSRGWRPRRGEGRLCASFPPLIPTSRGHCSGLCCGEGTGWALIDFKIELGS